MDGEAGRSPRKAINKRTRLKFYPSHSLRNSSMRSLAKGAGPPCLHSWRRQQESTSQPKWRKANPASRLGSGTSATRTANLPDCGPRTTTSSGTHRASPQSRGPEPATGEPLERMRAPSGRCPRRPGCGAAPPSQQGNETPRRFTHFGHSRSLPAKQSRD